MKNKPLSDIEWTTCWMAIRYALGGQTIATGMLPAEIIRAYYKRFTPLQIEKLVRELNNYKQTWGTFGHKDIDNPHWQKFLSALNKAEHEEVELINGDKCTIFKVNGRMYPLHLYISNPFQEYYMPKESIKKPKKGSI